MTQAVMDGESFIQISAVHPKYPSRVITDDSNHGIQCLTQIVGLRDQGRHDLNHLVFAAALFYQNVFLT